MCTMYNSMMQAAGLPLHLFAKEQLHWNMWVSATVVSKCGIQ